MIGSQDMYVELLICSSNKSNMQCVRKVAVHLQKVLEVMSTNVCTGLNLFNCIHKHFLQICL
jgi:hypothetical protein